MPALRRHSLRLLVVALVALGAAAAPTPAAAQSTRADSVAAVGTVARFEAALAAQDSVQASALLASDVLVLESGTVETRAAYLGHHLSADMKAKRDSKGARTLVRVTMLNNAAYVVSTTSTPSTNAEGSNASEMAELMVLSKTNTGWVIRAIHWSSRRRRA